MLTARATLATQAAAEACLKGLLWSTYAGPPVVIGCAQVGVVERDEAKHPEVAVPPQNEAELEELLDMVCGGAHMYVANAVVAVHVPSVSQSGALLEAQVRVSRVSADARAAAAARCALVVDGTCVPLCDPGVRRVMGPVIGDEHAADGVACELVRDVVAQLVGVHKVVTPTARRRGK